MKALTRILTFALAILAGGLSFLENIIDGDGKNFFRNCFDLKSEAMSWHFARLWSHLPWTPEFDWEAYRKAGHGGEPGSFYHALKNIIVEWVRIDANRAGKFLGFLATLAFGAGLAVGSALL